MQAESFDPSKASQQVTVVIEALPHVLIAHLRRFLFYGVLYHHGMSASEGHSTVDVLDTNTHGSHKEAWLYINDEIVSTMR
jgi:hypothetical protein